jgi:hypothetical protein
MVEKEFKYSVDHRDELLKTYRGQVLVIVDEEVVGNYDTVQDAWDDAVEKHEEGTFLIQRCMDDEDSFQQTFHSRVYV